MYPDERIERKVRAGSSPVLQELSNDKRRYVIFKDLLQGNFESFNRDIKRYLDIINEGKDVLEKYETEEKLSEAEEARLQEFLRKIEAMSEGVRDTDGFEDVDFDNFSVEENIQALHKNFQVPENKTIVEEFTDTFLRRGGFDSINEAITYYEKKREAVTQRNKENVAEGEITIDDIDIAKGVQLDYFDTQMDKGIYAPEFIGAETKEARRKVEGRGDHTPLDTDVTKARHRPVSEIVATSRSYGDITLLIQDRDQFHDTSDEEEPQYQEGSPGLFEIGGDHWGIRTGFGSSHIDAIAVTERLQNDTERLDELKFLIAKQGFYIPIANKEGEVIFSYDDYQMYREVFAGIDSYFGGEVQVSDDWKQSQVADEISEYKQTEENMETIEYYRNDLYEDIATALKTVGLDLSRAESVDSLLNAEVVDTGSTGRAAALDLEEGIDFDFVIKLNDNDFEKHEDVADKLSQMDQYSLDDSYWQGKRDQMHMFRFLDFEHEETGQEMSLDIGFVRKSDRRQVDTQDALKQKYESIEGDHGREKLMEVLTNVRFAKKKLKEANCYKNGGIGGVGVENWILQNGGDAYQAFRDLYESAYYESGQLKSLTEFKQEYDIFSAGVNIRDNEIAENFVDDLSAASYEKMAKLAKQLVGHNG